MDIRYENKKQEIICERRASLTAGAHLHSHIELVYMVDGHTTVWVDDTEYALKQGDVFIAFPNQVHRYMTTSFENSWLLIFPEELCQEYNSWFKSFVPTSNVLTSGSFDAHRLLELIHTLSRYSNRQLDEFETIDAKGLVLSLLSVVLSKMNFTEEKMAETSVIKQMLGFCAANYTEELSLELLEKELHINRFYISHLFSKKLKIKFNDYVNSLRVTHACKLLRESDMNMMDIVSASGFTTVRTFNRTFLKMIGETPSKYRKKCRMT